LKTEGKFVFVGSGEEYIFSYKDKGARVYIDHADWLTGGYFTDAREFESRVRTGAYAIVEDEAGKDTKILFYYVGRQDSIQKAVQTKDGFKVSWNSFVGDCFYSTDQVKDFIAAGNWVVVGVE
jgi:hypothetical protein